MRTRTIAAAMMFARITSADFQTRLEANNVATAAHSVARSAVARLAACLPIPITGTVEIALNAVQVSVNPRAVTAFAVGDNLACCVPIIFACPPQRHQHRHKPVWRLWSCETYA